MPNAHRSFYADEVGGYRHWTHLSEELPAKVASFFAVSTAREDTFVAGLSMGGYGALKWALRDPSRFAAAASLSGVLDVAESEHLRVRLESGQTRSEQIWGTRVWEDPGLDPRDDLFALLRTTPADRLPALMVRCGEDDARIAMNTRFADALAEHGVEADVAWTPGDHTWDFWDAHIQDVLAWLPLRAPV